MTLLTVDTLYYRDDHPDGYKFGEGTPAPDPADGWVTAPNQVAPPPPRQFEAASMEEFEGLLATARLNTETVQAELVAAQTTIAALNGQIDELKKDVLAAQAAEQIISAEQ